MRKKYNGYLTVGLLFNAAFLIANQTEMVPDLLKGLLAGIAIFLMMFGIYADCHDISKCRNKKKQLIKRVFGR